MGGSQVGMKSPALRLTTVAAAVSAAIGLDAGINTAMAQRADTLEEVVVTGSRIVRRDFEANSPITTIEVERFEESSTIAIESVLNQLPHFVPAITQFDAGGIGQGVQRTPGSATVSLRGLGANRNLVLLDGRRAMPINGSMAVSVNTIPAAALQRVETITGGASSVYGADAMSGVVNFILKDNFEGVDFNTQWGSTIEGGGEEFTMSALFGTNFADGRGNIMMGIEYTERDAIDRRERDFYTSAWGDPFADTATCTCFYYPPALRSQGGNRWTQDALDTLYDQAPPGSVGNALDQNTNPDGTAHTYAAGGNYRYTGPMTTGEFPNYIDVEGNWPLMYIDGVTGDLRQNIVTGQAQNPLERWSVFSRMRYDLTDNLTAFGTFMFNDSSTNSVGSPGLMLGGWRTSVPHGDGIYAPSLNADGTTNASYLPGGLYGVDCAPTGGCSKSEVWPMPADFNFLLASRPDPEADAELDIVTPWYPLRSSATDTTLFQLVAGVEGEIPSRNWTWEAYASYGNVRTNGRNGGIMSLERYRFVTRQPNYGTNMFYTGNPLGGGAFAGNASCTSGLPLLWGVNGWGPESKPTQDCINAVGAKPKAYGVNTQTIAEFNLQGPITELPAGELLFALGTSYRENSMLYLADTLNHNKSILDLAAGATPVGDADGRTSTSEVYGELVVPLLAGKPGFQQLNLELGYRKSFQHPTEDIDSYKALLDWRVVDRVRLRGGRQVANRAPNIGELFQTDEQSAIFTSTGDWCSDLNPVNTLSPNPSLNPDAAEARMLCEALMGPAGASEFYANPLRRATATGTQFSYLSGNPNLRSERAETFTFGLVADVTDTIRVSLDYWDIEIIDMIAAQLPDTLYAQCMSPITNPNYDPLFEPCTRIVRDKGTGENAASFVDFSNKGAIRTSGYDMQLDWGRDLGPGALSLNVLGSVTDSLETRPEPGDNWKEWKGTSGPTDLSGINPFVYEYRVFTTIGYTGNGWTGSVRWRHLASIEADGNLNNPGRFTPAGAYDMVDVAGRYDLRDNIQLRFGIDNFFDRDPELVFPDARTGYNGRGETEENFYDILGRRYYIGFNIQI